jgi:hypothetical protein
MCFATPKIPPPPPPPPPSPDAPQRSAMQIAAGMIKKPDSKGLDALRIPGPKQMSSLNMAPIMSPINV